MLLLLSYLSHILFYHSSCVIEKSKNEGNVNEVSRKVKRTSSLVLIKTKKECIHVHINSIQDEATYGHHIRMQIFYM